MEGATALCIQNSLCLCLSSHTTHAGRHTHTDVFPAPAALCFSGGSEGYDSPEKRADAGDGGWCFQRIDARAETFSMAQTAMHVLQTAGE